jgi:hypothetical protein
VLAENDQRPFSAMLLRLSAVISQVLDLEGRGFSPAVNLRIVDGLQPLKPRLWYVRMYL